MQSKMKNEITSFIILKQALSKRQKDMIINYEYWTDFFINNIDDVSFDNFDKKTWSIKEHNDFIFGETDNNIFDMNIYLKYISVDNRYIIFDIGNKTPSEMQIEFIEDRKLDFNNDEIEKIENLKVLKQDFKTSGGSNLSLSKSKPNISGINTSDNKSKRHEKKRR